MLPEKWELFKTYCIRDVDVENRSEISGEIPYNRQGTGALLHGPEDQ